MGNRTIRFSESFSSRWSPEVAAKGFYMKPVCMMRCFDDLGLTMHEALLLDLLFSYWFNYDSPPEVYPSNGTLSKALGMGYSTIGKHMRSLEAKGFIMREERVGASNIVHLEYTIDIIRNHVVRRHPP